MNKEGQLTKSDLIKHIKKQKRYNKRLNLLGFVENKELTPELESYFTQRNCWGIVAGYDWVNGNDKLKALLNEL